MSGPSHADQIGADRFGESQSQAQDNKCSHYHDASASDMLTSRVSSDLSITGPGGANSTPEEHPDHLSYENVINARPEQIAEMKKESLINPLKNGIQSEGTAQGTVLVNGINNASGHVADSNAQEDDMKSQRLNGRNTTINRFQHVDEPDEERLGLFTHALVQLLPKPARVSIPYKFHSTCIDRLVGC